MILDTSALIAILYGEPERADFARLIRREVNDDRMVRKTGKSFAFIRYAAAAVGGGGDGGGEIELTAVIREVGRGISREIGKG